MISILLTIETIETQHRLHPRRPRSIKPEIRRLNFNSFNSSSSSEPSRNYQNYEIGWKLLKLLQRPVRIASFNGFNRANNSGPPRVQQVLSFNSFNRSGPSETIKTTTTSHIVKTSFVGVLASTQKTISVTWSTAVRFPPSNLSLRNPLLLAHSLITHHLLRYRISPARIVEIFHYLPSC